MAGINPNYTLLQKTFTMPVEKDFEKLWKALKRHQETLTDEEFVNMLKKEVHDSVANVYTNWNK